MPDSTDAYDFLTTEALCDGRRIAPLFRVFCNPPSDEPLVDRMSWRVCQTDAIGDPVETMSLHVDLKDALRQAAKLNREAGVVRPEDQREYSVYQPKPGDRQADESLTDWVLRVLALRTLSFGRKR